MSGITIRDEGEIRVVTFARPEAMNAWDRAMRSAIKDAINAADAASSVAGLVFTGEGERAFGAGQDLREPGPRDGPEIDRWVDEWEAFFGALRGCSKPTVAALNGVAAGSSFQFALLADARVGHSGIRMGQPELKSGIASSMGPWIIQTWLGPAMAQDLVLSGRLMGAEECAGLGLVRLVPREEVLAAAVALARDLSSRPRHAMSLTKARLRDLSEAGFREVFPAWKRLLRQSRAAETE